MNKKIIFVSMLTMGMLIGCGNDKTTTKEIELKEAMAKINEHKDDINTYDRIGALSTIDKFKVESKALSSKTENKITISFNDAKFDMKVSGLVSATNVNGLSASIKGKVGSILIEESGTSDVSESNIAVNGYFDNSNLYFDLSNKELKSFIEKVDREPIPAEDPDKIYVPLRIKDSLFPLLTEETLTKYKNVKIEDLIDPNLIVGLIGNIGVDLSQFSQASSILISSLDINEYVKVKTSKDYADFSFSVELTKDNLVKGIESAMKTAFRSIKPSESLTEEEKALIDAQVAFFVSTFNSSLEQGGFEFIKLNLEIRDYLITELSYDVKAGISMKSTPLFDEGGNLIEDQNNKMVNSLVVKGNTKFSYGNKVTVDTLSDYSEFRRPPIHIPSSNTPNSDSL